MKKLLQIFPFVGLLGSLLSIARTNGTPQEMLVYYIFGGICVVLIAILASKPIVRWTLRWYRIIKKARSLDRITPNETNLERFDNLIRRHAVERPAQEHEVEQIVCEASILIESKNRAQMLGRFRQEILKAKLIWCRWHEVDGSEFNFDFDDFLFLNPNSQEPSLELIRHHIKDDILRRFGGKQFHTLVYVLRDKNNHRLGRFFEELKGILQFDEFIGFPLDSIRRDKDSVLKDELSVACMGKSILLVDPLLIDDRLDKTFETITNWGGIVNGIVAMFEVKGVDVKKFHNYETIKQKTGQPEFQGQILLDLQTRLT